MTGPCDCGAEFSEVRGASNMVQCSMCGQWTHKIAANHSELLRDLQQDSDQAIATLADTIVGFDGR